MPAIYTANEAARRQLQAQLNELAGGYVALVGPAGVGKSTLPSSLTWPQRRVVRYYAFVPDASDPLSGRGEAESFLNDVSLALEAVGVRRPGYGNDLRTQRAVLQEQLADAGEQWRDGGEVKSQAHPHAYLRWRFVSQPSRRPVVEQPDRQGCGA